MAASLFVIGPAGADQQGAVLDCGTIITEDTVLVADIGPCGDVVSEPGHASGGHGLVIGADGVDLDLNGHTIFGLGGSVVPHQASGVLVDGHSDVSVSDGTVRDFFHGVQVVNGSHNTVSGIASIDNTNGNGIVLRNVTDSSLSHNTVLDSGRFGGISVFDGRRPEQLDDLPSAGNVIANNVVERSDNGPNTAGISLENGPGHKVINNRVSGSSGDGINLRADNPLPSGRVLAAVTGAMVVNNVVTGNGTNAANIAPPLAGISLRQNVNTGVGSDNNQIIRNRVENNADHGIFVASRNNRIANNRSLGNAVNDLFDANLTPPCDNNTWRNNTFATFNQACVTS